jgi:hypothetical protein
LGHSAWHLGEPRALQSLDDSAFLVGGHEETNAGGRQARGLGLNGIRDGTNRRRPGRRAVDEPDGAHVIRLDLLNLRGTELVVGKSEQKQLSDPLVFGHAGEHLISAGRCA